MKSGRSQSAKEAAFNGMLAALEGLCWRGRKVSRASFTSWADYKEWSVAYIRGQTAIDQARKAMEST